MNKTADPCDDFYAYACGGWEKSHFIEPDRTSVSQFSVLSDENDLLLKQILEEPKPAAKGAVAMAYQWYDACMDTETNNAEALAVFKTEVMPLFSNLHKGMTTATFTAAVAAAHLLNIDVFYYAGSGADDIDPTKHSLFMGQSGLTFPDRDYYAAQPDEPAEDAAKRAKEHAALRTYIAKAFLLYGENATVSEAAAEAVVAFESKLAAIFIPRDDLRDPMKNYNKIEFQDMKNMVSNIAWGQYLRAIGAPNSARQALVVENLQYMQALDALLSGTDSMELRYYMMWRAIYTFGSKVNEDFTDLWLEEYVFLQPCVSQNRF